MMRLCVFCSLLLFLSLSLTGCGEKLPPGMPPLCPCELTVLQENAPLAGATIMLVPESGTPQWNIAGITNEQGILQVFTNGKYNGIPAGKYKIVITKIEETGKAPPIPQVGEEGYDKAVSNMQNAKSTFKRFQLVEKQYTSPNTTPLTIEITGRNKIAQQLNAGKPVHESM